MRRMPMSVAGYLRPLSWHYRGRIMGKFHAAGGRRCGYYRLNRDRRAILDQCVREVREEVQHQHPLGRWPTADVLAKLSRIIDALRADIAAAGRWPIPASRPSPHP